MLEGASSEDRLRRLQRGFRSRKTPKRFRIRARDAGLAFTGALIGAGSMAALDVSQRPDHFASAPVYYANCREAIQDGAAPIYRGQPGYRSPLDADDDGIACEPFRMR